LIVTTGLGRIYESRHRTGWFRSEARTTAAVEDLNLEIPTGELFGLLGPNGAGKTTTIKMLCTLLEPTSGSAEVGGYDVRRRANEVRAIVNMVAGGERMLYWRLTGRENLWYFGRLYGLRGASLSARVDYLLGLVGLSDSADLPVERYSKGMKQRLQIARGLINAPRYLFLDEPTIGLDADIARSVRQVVKRLTTEEGVTVLLTTHYMAEAEELCDRVAVMHQGRIIALGTAADLKRLVRREQVTVVTLRDGGEELRAALQQVADRTNARLTLDTEGPGEGCVEPLIRARFGFGDRVLEPALCHLLGEYAAQITGIHTVEPSLEDAVIALSRDGAPDTGGIVAS